MSSSTTSNVSLSHSLYTFPTPSPLSHSSLSPPSVNTLEAPLMRGMREPVIAMVSSLSNSHSLHSSLTDQQFASSALKGEQLSSGKSISDAIGTNTVKSVDSSLSLPTVYLTSPSTSTSAIPTIPTHIKEEPVYIERYSSFCSVSSLSTLFSALSSTLLSHDVDYTFQAEKAKYKCVSYDCSSQSIQFIVKIYQSKSVKTQKVCEFQRRAGCCVAFNRIYQQFFKDLSALSVVLSPYVTSFNGHAISPCALPHPLLPFPSPSLSHDVLLSLSNMAISPDLCSAREALRVMASCDMGMNGNGNDANQNCNNANGSDIDHLIQMILSVLSKGFHDDEQERSVYTLFSRLAENEHLRSKLIVKSLISFALSAISQPIVPSALNSSISCIQVKETKRRIAHALSLLSSTHAKELQSTCAEVNVNYAEMMGKQCESTDLKMGGWMKETLQRVTNVV